MRIFLTTILPEKLISKHRLSFAACNFSFNLMSGGGFDKVYSILPLYVGGEMDKEAFEDEKYELEYCHRLRRMGRRWNLLACMIEQWRLFRKIPSGSKIWTYNLNTLLALTVLLLKLFKPSVQVNVIVLDFTPVTKGFGLNRMYLKLINSVHGNICLANSDLFTCKNRVVLPGVVPQGAGDEPRITEFNNKFLLSGALSETIAQISMVLKAFSELPECELHITGSPENEEMIKQYASEYHNIIYHGKVSFAEYMQIMHGCTYQLSTRDENSPENKCNFPSKIIETLLHNRIIISTIEYPQLKGVNYFKVDSEIEHFKKQISDIAQLDHTTLQQYANKGEKVTAMFSTEVWNDSMTKIENS